jgi:catechol 2,3-dioxygenase-like lactoylglutathione lyase family enzyme
MSEYESVSLSGAGVAAASAPALCLHHVAIQTSDLANSVSWYGEFLGFRQAWSLTSFSELTRSRLPGIRRLVELTAGDMRLHLFERAGRPAPAPGDSVSQFQHICVGVDSAEELATLRARWIRLFESGQYSFATADQPTEVVTDADGVQSFYAYDVNGLEFEISYAPEC